MIFICVICMIKRPPLLPLSSDHRKILEAIVSPVLDISDLRSCHLLLCGECTVLMRSMYNVQQTALVGVKNLRNLLSRLGAPKNIVLVPAKASTPQPLPIQPNLTTSQPKGHEYVKVLVPAKASTPQPLPIQPNVTTTQPQGHEYVKVLMPAKASTPQSLLIQPNVTTTQPKGYEYVKVPAKASTPQPLLIQPNVTTTQPKGYEYVKVPAKASTPQPLLIQPNVTTTQPKGHEYVKVLVPAKASTPQPLPTQPNVTTTQPKGHEYVKVLVPAKASNPEPRRIQPNVTTTQPEGHDYIKEAIPAPVVKKEPDLEPTEHGTATEPNYIQNAMPALVVIKKEAVLEPMLQQEAVHDTRLKYIQNAMPATVVVKEEPMVPEAVYIVDPQYQTSNVKEEDVKVEKLDSEGSECERVRDSESTLTCESDYGGPEDLPAYVIMKMPVISDVRSCNTAGESSGSAEDFTGQAGVSNNHKKGKKKRKKLLTPRKPKRSRDACEQCGKTFNTIGYLRDHIQRVHSVSSSVKCDECGKRFKNGYRLRDHKYNKHRKKGTPTPLFCGECQMTFVAPIEYKRHMALQHREQWQRSVKCEHCTRKFPTELGLQAHIKCIHYNQKYKCSKCDMSFGTRGGLERHEKGTHAAEITGNRLRHTARPYRLNRKYKRKKKKTANETEQTSDINDK